MGIKTSPRQNIFIGWVNDSYILLHQFIKKTQKTPARELEKAKRELADIIERLTIKSQEVGKKKFPYR